MRVKFDHKVHPHVEDRRKRGPSRLRDQVEGFNGKIALILTNSVGTMWCAYVFAALALVALPDAIKGGALTIIQWISQTFIQLVMLSVIMVGQNILGKASDERAQLTYDDADATFHEAQQIQTHLQAQDDALNAMMERLERLEAGLQKLKPE